MPFASILVATDFSKTSLRAGQMASDLAEKLGAEVSYLHVVDTSVLTTGFAGVNLSDLAKSLEDSARVQMDEFVATLEHKAGEVKTHLIRDYRPADAVAEQANALGCDLLVIGTHGRSGFRRFIFGSVAERVVRLARVPVLTIGPPAEVVAEAAAESPSS
ncbi:MAG: universal stress protein [Planctomycetota bacterium]|jgi:nucleotide-binding universal stress UspA family protein